jgi:hypothetical protein
LFNSIQQQYGLSAQDAEKIIQSAKIYHPYGMVGELLGAPSNATPVTFGGEFYGDLHKNIRTFDEEVSVSDLPKIKLEVQKADVIIFLGFHFLPQNMQLLDSGGVSQVKRVYATAYGMSDEDKEVCDGQIRNMLWRKSPAGGVKINNNLKCSHLFDNYSKSITH